MKFGSIAASRGRNVARAYCGLNLRARRSLDDDGEDKGQENDAADEGHAPTRLELSLQSFGEACKDNDVLTQAAGMSVLPSVVWSQAPPPWGPIPLGAVEESLTPRVCSTMGRSRSELKARLFAAALMESKPRASSRKRQMRVVVRRVAILGLV